ncbi:CyP450 monooxygenase [Stereum hirsutum FP-91666 SS1]|uniref:CyP450 monooxygenase n=1 Tax=Stereum hirsutum (strain FP-91666) TaxID=721885 RepID=UPI000444931B|nr:CyP450 monooxygenase [Stereum hirsutum FP-91666 SS1]EIM84332.1 CyP450 monooxygenase [Stereum hirsutum FP-91666 SS1]
MSSPKYLAALDIAASALSVLLFLKLFTLRSSRKHAFPPPGPRQLPIIGNLLDFPSHDHGERLGRLRKQYGDLMSLRMMGQTIIVINSARIARDLLDRRARIWSDRPVIPLLQLMQLYEWNTTFIPESPDHRAQRRIADRYLRPSALIPYRPMIRCRVDELLRSLLHGPNEFKGHLRYFMTGVIMSIAFGYNLKGEKDVYVTKTEAFAEAIIDSMSPTSSIVNVFPILRHLPTWIPGIGKMRYVDEVRRLGLEIREEPFDFVKKSISDGTAEPSLSRHSFMMAEEDGQLSSKKNQEHTKHCSSLTLPFLAGVDTTGVALTNLVLALLLYPEVQRSAQTQLDSVVGRERLPSLDDRGKLPYIEATCKELLRWRLVTQIGIAHATKDDDVYDGYFIPKGKHLSLDFAAMLHDPVRYPDPESFRPERFLTPSGEYNDDPHMAVAFGFGRRICPGRHLVDEILYTFVSSFLSVLTVEKKKDEDGNEIPVSGKHAVDVALSQPLPFECSILPRDNRASQLIQSTGDGQEN